MHRHFAIYLPRQSPLNTLNGSSSRRPPAASSPRPRGGWLPAGSVVLVTNLAVFRLDEATGRFRVTEVFPWTTFPEPDATGFELGIDSPEASSPGADGRRARLRRRVDPLGIRKLELSQPRSGPAPRATIRAEAELARVPAAVLSDRGYGQDLRDAPPESWPYRAPRPSARRWSGGTDGMAGSSITSSSPVGVMADARRG
jgi:hypothetical protein